MKTIVGVVLAIWLAVVLWLGAAGSFARPPGTPPIPLLLGVVVPVLVFLAAYWGWAAFRAFVLAIDLRLATAIQAWRAGGLVFLAMYAHGLLPGAFAWPAGLGDIAIGVTAPWILLALLRRPGFASSPGFVVWNLLGMLDLVVAIGTGGTLSALASGAAGEVTMAPMTQLPLLLIPVYLVPLFFMLHLVALWQARQKARAAQSGGQARPAPAEEEAVTSASERM